MPELITKLFTPSHIELKADAPGSLSVEFATLNVIDHDGDITLPGAFGDQEVRIQSHGHDTHGWSIGKGSIKESGDRAIMDGKLNLDMAGGKEGYASLKFDMENGTPLQEWSYVFDIADADFGERDGRPVRFLKRLNVHSVDPVFLGAGIGTHTLAVKEVKSLPLAEATAKALAGELTVKQLTEWLEMVNDRKEFREKEGRVLSSANFGALVSVRDDMLAPAVERIGVILNSAEPEKQADAEELSKLRAQFERSRALVS
jgi:hypothetical protein